MIRPTHARISHRALRNNLRVIRQRLSPGSRIMAVVKANCYGHGVDICLPTLLAEGIDLFAVATVEEARTLRRLGLRERVVVLAPPLQGQYGEFVELDAEPLLSSVEQARQMSAVADAAGARLRAHLFLDTGLARDGFPPGDVIGALEGIGRLAAIDLVGFSSHFACSDEPGNAFNDHQMALFDATLAAAREGGYRFADIHLANSGGIFNYPGSHHQVVRPGLALYGYHPTPELQSASGLMPVMSVRTTIANITRIPAGAPVSYGRRYYTPRESLIATLPLGYADGLMRTLTNRLEVLAGGRRYPVVGTICMDEVMVNLGEATDVAVGDEVLVTGRQGSEQIDAWELAERAGTIPYEICTNISSRVPRIGSDD
jgi:alanine racemase